MSEALAPDRQSIGSSLEARLRRVLGEIMEMNPEDVGTGTSIDTVPTWDSMRQLILVGALEQEFDIRFSDQETAELLSYTLVKLTLEERLAKRESLV